MTVLSDLPPRIAGVWHPWRALRHQPEITVEWRALDGRLGCWDAATKTITMHPRQGQAQGRVTATHEQIHAEWGHDGCQPPGVELAVKKAAARRLIHIYALVDAVLFYGEHDLAALAEELWVDQETVAIRLAWLHPAERGFLQQCLARRDEVG